MKRCLQFTALCPGTAATETLTLDGVSYPLCKECWHAADMLSRKRHRVGVSELFKELQAKIQKERD